MFCQNCVFASGRICRTCSAFWCTWATKVDTLFFMLGWYRYRFHEKHTGTRYVELVFLHPVGSTGHVVHSAHPGCETSEHYFSCLGGSGMDSKKAQWNTLRRTCVFTSGGICGHGEHSVCLGREMLVHYFFLLW
jgi:hypothetical protein